MGYGKRANKGKNALSREFDEVNALRRGGFITIGIGFAVILLSLIVTTLIPVVVSGLGEDATFPFTIAGFIGTFLGAILVALGFIRLSQTSADYKRLKSKLGK